MAPDEWWITDEDGFIKALREEVICPEHGLDPKGATRCSCMVLNIWRSYTQEAPDV